MAELDALSEIIGTLRAEVKENRRQHDASFKKLDGIENKLTELSGQLKLLAESHSDLKLQVNEEIKPTIADYKAMKNRGMGVIALSASWGAALVPESLSFFTDRSSTMRICLSLILAAFVALWTVGVNAQQFPMEARIGMRCTAPAAIDNIAEALEVGDEEALKVAEEFEAMGMCIFGTTIVLATKQIKAFKLADGGLRGIFEALTPTGRAVWFIGPMQSGNGA